MHPPPLPHADRPLVVILGVGLVFAAAAGTQYAAWRFGFRPTLGAPLLVFNAHTTRLLRAVTALATGGALSALCMPRLRALSGPLVLIALGAGLASVGPVYPPSRVFVWY